MFELFKKTPPRGTPQAEINEQIRQGYLDRLHERARKMRRLNASRQWTELGNECRRLDNTAAQHGFPHLARVARVVARQIPESQSSRATPTRHMRQDFYQLISVIDEILLKEDFQRREE